MKEEIKKKIEEEKWKANGYTLYAKEIKAPIFNEGFVAGAKYVYSLFEHTCTYCGCTTTQPDSECYANPKNISQQSVNSELDFYANELNRERIKTYTDLSERYLVTLSSIRDIFDAGLNFAADKYKAILSASQNGR